MSCNVEFTDDGLTFKNLNLKYINTKTDKYDNEVVYYSILNENIKSVISKLITSNKLPYFLGEKNHILKVKSKYLTEEQKISGTATVKMKFYTYNEFNGYYVNELEFE